MRRSTKLVGAVAALTTLFASGASPAFADVVQNNVSASGSPTIVAGGSTLIAYKINDNAPERLRSTGRLQCRGRLPATLTVTAPAAVTVAPASRVYSTCGTTQFFDFTSSTPGSYSIGVSVTDTNTNGGRYVTTGATFSLLVTKAPEVNTAPTVTVAGVSSGAAYEFGNVPAATCNVVDKEDGNSSFRASLSAITGARAAEGLGSQTASCNYDDAGGLNAKASVAYSIVDTRSPLVTATAPASKEATAPLTPVTFAASAYDAVDGDRPVTCKTAGGTVFASGGSFPVGTTTLTCSATDRAGNTGTSDPFNVVVTDTTGPSVTTPANIVVGNNAATVTYPNATATDLVDGSLAATCDKASGSVFPLGTTTVTCSATDAKGNKGTNTFTVEVQDATKPIVLVPVDQTVQATGANGATVSYGAATATDDVDGPLTPTCSKASARCSRSATPRSPAPRRTRQATSATASSPSPSRTRPRRS
jgi:hypothetical protein